MQFTNIATLFAAVLSGVVAQQSTEGWEVRAYSGEHCFGKEVYDSGFNSVGTEKECTKLPDATLLYTGQFPAEGRLCTYDNEECTQGTSLINVSGNTTSTGPGCPILKFKSYKVIGTYAALRLKISTNCSQPRVFARCQPSKTIGICWFDVYIPDTMYI
jgi:hypothetical protein